MGRANRRTLSSALPGDPTTDFTASLPWGYAPRRGVLAPTDEAAPVIRQIFTLASEGERPERIAAQVALVDDQGLEDEVSLVTSILDNPAYAGVWLTVGKLEAAVDPELWIEARKHLVDEIDPIEVSVVRKFGSTPPDVESRADATSG